MSEQRVTIHTDGACSGNPGPGGWGDDIGTGYGHVAIEVDDVYAACNEIKRLGGKVIREAGPMKGGTKAIAFVSDPDGYMIELIGKKA